MTLFVLLRPESFEGRSHNQDRFYARISSKPTFERNTVYPKVKPVDDRIDTKTRRTLILPWIGGQGRSVERFGMLASIRNSRFASGRRDSTLRLISFHMRRFRHSLWFVFQLPSHKYLEFHRVLTFRQKGNGS